MYCRDSRIVFRAYSLDTPIDEVIRLYHFRTGFIPTLLKVPLKYPEVKRDDIVVVRDKFAIDLLATHMLAFNIKKCEEKNETTLTVHLPQCCFGEGRIRKSFRRIKSPRSNID